MSYKAAETAICPVSMPFWHIYCLFYYTVSAMDDQIIHGSKLMEVLREKVLKAFALENIEPAEMVEFYIVNLLQDFHNIEGTFMCNGENSIEKPLSILLLEALDGNTTKQIKCLKNVGDMSLMVSGFFSDSLHKGLMRPQYYASIGETAYGNLAYIHEEDGAFFNIYLDLAQNFNSFAKVISIVAPWNHARSDAEVLRIYERWILTGDKTLQHVLEQKGILKKHLGEES